LEVKNLHIWDLEPKEAILIQKLLSKDLIIEGKPEEINLVAGCDISFNRFSDTGYAVVVVLSYPDLEIVEKTFHIGETKMKYIPGLLSFREAPLLIKAFEKVKHEPDVIMYDGQGIAHPRRIGIASHMGILTQKPSIGCAKSLLVGDFEEKQPIKGNHSPLYHKDELIGYALYTKDKCKPVFISSGHKVSNEFARDFTLSCTKKYKLPETTRQAHLFSNEIRRNVS
jgi:deoxyribonuclease V